MKRLILFILFFAWVQPACLLAESVGELVLERGKVIVYRQGKSFTLTKPGKFSLEQGDKIRSANFTVSIAKNKIAKVVKGSPPSKPVVLSPKMKKAMMSEKEPVVKNQRQCKAREQRLVPKRAPPSLGEQKRGAVKAGTSKKEPAKAGGSKKDPGPAGEKGAPAVAEDSKADEKPASAEKADDKPASDEPATGEPTTDEPATDEPPAEDSGPVNSKAPVVDAEVAEPSLDMMLETDVPGAPDVVVEVDIAAIAAIVETVATETATATAVVKDTNQPTESNITIAITR